MFSRKMLYRRFLLLVLASCCLCITAQARYTVQIASVRLAPWQAHITTLGEVRSLAQVVLRAPVDGQLQGPLVMEGVHVTSGHLLANIAPPGLEAQITAAGQRLKLSRALLSRTRALYKEHLDTRSEVLRALSQVASAREALTALNDKRRLASLTAPIAGSVHYLIPPGTAVLAGTAVIRIEGMGNLWIRTYVTPTAAHQLVLGKTATLTRNDWQGQGKISAIGDSARHDGLVEIIVRSPMTTALMPGEWLHLTLPGASGRAWKLPRAALVMQGAHTKIFVTHGGRAQVVKVSVVHVGSHHIWVKGPLHAGESVIVDGADSITDGTPIKVEQPNT